jgi:hypothetical protein
LLEINGQQVIAQSVTESLKTAGLLHISCMHNPVNADNIDVTSFSYEAVGIARWKH